jgi:hypothetical protein
MMPAADQTLQDYDAAILYLAECVVAHGERFAPFLDKVIAGRDKLANRQDPVARARAILDEARRRQAP